MYTQGNMTTEYNLAKKALAGVLTSLVGSSAVIFSLPADQVDVLYKIAAFIPNVVVSIIAIYKIYDSYNTGRVTVKSTNPLPVNKTETVTVDTPHEDTTVTTQTVTAPVDSNVPFQDAGV